MNSEARAMYREAMDCIETDYPRAVDLLKQSSENGCIEAEAEYAKILHNDEDYHDDRTAFMYFMDAAEHGNTESQYYVGIFYYEGFFVEKDYRNAAQWFRMSAEQGEPKSQYYLGVLYKNGEGVYRNYSQARRWFMQALERGNMESNYELAEIYANETTGLYDLSMALHYYEEASHNEIRDAHYYAGLYHFKGKGTAKNYITAAAFFKKGADNVDKRCLYLLGLMYDKGWGVPVDNIYALRLLSSAAMYGSKEARIYLDTKEIRNLDGENVGVEDDLFDLECNTPDIIAQVEGVEKKGGFFGFLRK